MWIWMEIEVLAIWFKKWDCHDHGVDRWGVGGGVDNKRMADTTCEYTLTSLTVHLRMVKILNFVMCILPQ